MRLKDLRPDGQLGIKPGPFHHRGEYRPTSFSTGSEQPDLDMATSLSDAAVGFDVNDNDNATDVRTAFLGGIFTDISTAVMLGVVCAFVLFVLVVVVTTVMWLRARRRRQKLLHDLTNYEGADQMTCSKSAPTSRSPSPKPGKRMSFPDTDSVCKKSGIFIRANTVDGVVPDMSLPPERVQPHSWGPGEGRDAEPRFTFPAVSPSAKYGTAFGQELSEDEGPHAPETPQGRLFFSVRYDSDVEQLAVTLINVENLSGRGSNNHPRDPFVKIYLLPDDRACRVSTVKKKTLNPVYDETKTFQVPIVDIKDRTLRFSVYDVDKRRVLHCLGHVMTKLKDIDLTNGGVLSGDLMLLMQSDNIYGELQTSLIYLPHLEKIKVGLHKVRNLTKFVHCPKNTGAYIRIQLFCGHKCHRVKSTLPVQGGEIITFNESLSFTIHGRQLDSCNLVISLMLTSPRFVKERDGDGTPSLTINSDSDIEYGRLVIGPFMYARGQELAHWQEMLSQPRKASTKWHALTGGVLRKSSVP